MSESETVRRRLNRPHPMTAGYLVAAVIFCVAIATGVLPGGVNAGDFYANRWPTPYAVTDYGSLTGFYYSPPVALLFAPLTAFGFGPFAAILAATGLIALYAVLGRWAWAGLFFLPIWWDISAGNISTVFAAVALFGLRWPGLFAIPLLTKVTSGVGLLWFLFRKEWRPLFIALGVTGIVCVASFAIAPQLWPQWIASLSHNVGYVGPGFFIVPVPLSIRLAAAVAIVWWGARTDRRWTVPVAMLLGTPVFWLSAFAILAAVPMTIRRREEAALRTSPSLEQVVVPRPGLEPG